MKKAKKVVKAAPKKSGGMSKLKGGLRKYMENKVKNKKGTKK